MGLMEPANSHVLPADPASRGRLWREWMHLDPPQVDRPRVERRSATRVAAAPADWLDEVIDRPAGVVSGLSMAVRECLIDGELPAADRERIVARAARLGIARFEATLLIATVQHRARAELGVRPTLSYTIPAHASWGIGKLLACVLAAEAIIAGAGYLMWTR